ncbi:dihydrolipoyl dehydrogenase family protein [Bauldia litoralis]|uniref:Pyruvate/2-oxoglutarate dehydrogenase complex, dihydrolipoamide dehydrogenase (E3) component n=1 Tax=Bauldia litoralis TaxID=665467 RepID=A0A1G6DYZ0_9HYPH|nr:mercuric reductase [Bauldia litoralis]SDB50407.1 Pyruvate/2-oxoglutarate dehydrogenase complex, dihydrolipoamide dehydrogenase (E3) component [Bauldia litoralis]
MRHLDVDICIIGGGSAGLSVAAGAAQLGARTVLFERRKMGGECLNYGCVPSKALIASARSAEAVRSAPGFGVKADLAGIDFAAAVDRVDRVIATIAPHDSEERFESLGVTVVRSNATFTGPDTVEGDGVTVKARRFVIATGSNPAAPPIDGLDTVPYLTNETIFANRTLPEHLLVVGGGPIGVEMAQAHRRLGARVTVAEADRIVAREDPELTAVIRDRLIAEGIDILEGARVKRFQMSGETITATIDADGERDLTVSHVLVAAGRKPQIDGLGLEAAGVDHTRAGITVDNRLRTSNRRIFAIGDISGGPQFTHVAGYQAGIVIRNALFRLPAKVDYRALPWVTFTDPELARVGLLEAEAREQIGSSVEALTVPFGKIDRAIAEDRTDGQIKLVLGKRGRILGASIVGDHAGELIHLWALAMGQKLGAKAVAGMIAPYPTMGEISKRVAGEYYAKKLFSPWPRRIVRFLGRFG